MTPTEISSVLAVFAATFLLLPAVYAQTANNQQVPTPVVVDEAETEGANDQNGVLPPDQPRQVVEPQAPQTSASEENSRIAETGCQLSHQTIQRIMHSQVSRSKQLVTFLEQTATRVHAFSVRHSLGTEDYQATINSVDSQLVSTHKAVDELVTRSDNFTCSVADPRQQVARYIEALGATIAELRTLHEHTLTLTQLTRESAHGQTAAGSDINTTERHQLNLNSGRR